jgi:galactoside O-acetyltransferase
MSKYNIPGLSTFEYTKIVGIENIEFGSPVLIDDFVFIYAKNKIKLGNHVHIATFTSITGGESFTMGNFAGLATGTKIITATDDFKDWGFGGPTLNLKYRNVTRKPIHIGDFCIVGANSVILPGVTIGEGAMVGANSVVTRDLEPWGIYIGNRRVSERNQQAVLENYRLYLEDTQSQSDG